MASGGCFRAAADALTMLSWFKENPVHAQFPPDCLRHGRGARRARRSPPRLRRWLRPLPRPSRPRRIMAPGASISRAPTPRSRPATISISMSTAAGSRARRSPADQASVSSFYDIYNLTLEQKKYVIASQGPDTQIGGLYKSFMDEKAVEKAGDKALRAELAKVAALPDKSALAATWARPPAAWAAPSSMPASTSTLPIPRSTCCGSAQGGLGLPDRDYYLKDSFKPQRDAYLAYIARQLGLAGYPNPAKGGCRHHGLRDRDREAELADRGPPRAPEDQQSDDAGSAQDLCARPRLGRAARRRGRRQAGG